MRGYDRSVHAGIQELEAVNSWLGSSDKQTYWSLTWVGQGLALMRLGAKSIEHDVGGAATGLGMAGWRFEARGADAVLKDALPVSLELMLEGAEGAFQEYRKARAEILKLGKWRASVKAPRWTRKMGVRLVTDRQVTEVLRLVVGFDESGKVADWRTELDV